MFLIGYLGYGCGQEAFEPGEFEVTRGQGAGGGQDRVEKRICDADDLPGAPGRDVIARIISGREVAANQQDAVTVAVALACDTGRDPAAVAGRIRDLWVAARMAPSLPGRMLGTPLGECDPMDLEVHRAIEVPDHGRWLPALPAYVQRGHDARLREVVAAAAGGASRMAVLVGGSSTGKTRACWEAIQQLPDQWRLWHPIDPSRPEAADRALGEVGPYTVVWLNDAQHYLLTLAPTLGERVCAGLRSLLRDRSRGPVLVLATMWPQHWATLTTAPLPGDPDLHTQARELLAGADIPVPDRFSGPELESLRTAAADDPRLRHAAEHAPNGRITQQLAGVPELLARYRNAPPAARAVMDVAIDARRLDHPLPIPHEFLQQAAPSYLSDYDWDRAGDDWFEQALAYASAPCHGVPGPLTRLRPRPGEPAPAGGQRLSRLADYLEQTGARERAEVFPPAGFWNAATATVTDTWLLHRLGHQAERRGRYGRAAQLYRKATDHGLTAARWSLARLRLQAGDRAGAEQQYRQAADHGNISALVELGRLREQAGDHAAAAELYQQAAGKGDLQGLLLLAQPSEQGVEWASVEAVVRRAAEGGNLHALHKLAWLRRGAGDQVAAERLFRQAADRGHVGAMSDLAWFRMEAGDHADADELFRRADERGEPATPPKLTVLRADDRDDAEALVRQAIDRGEMHVLWLLAQAREEADDRDGAERLYQQIADHGNIDALPQVARLREQAGDRPGAEQLYQQAAECGNVNALRKLAALREHNDKVSADLMHQRWLQILERESIRDRAGAAALARQAADDGNTRLLAALAAIREQRADPTGAEELYQQAADRGNIEALMEATRLRGPAGDWASVEAQVQNATDRGEDGALRSLARLREQAGDLASAERIRRFGLDDAGAPEASLE